MSDEAKNIDVCVVGAGFTGLAAAMSLARAGKSVVVVEADDGPGGLASAFDLADGVRVEKFYHHWFDSDTHLPEIIGELGLQDRILTAPSRTGMYYNKQIWRLSTPLDLLTFKPLSLIDRIRLGLLVFRVRRVTDWRAIEHLSVREWLEPLCGAAAFRIVWQPLLEHKFSIHADEVGAVWMWKKLALRGGTRNARGGEQLAYFKGGFGDLAQAMADDVTRHGGVVRYGTRISRAVTEGDRVAALKCTDGSEIRAKQFLFTPALPIIADWFRDAPGVNAAWLASLRRVKYLGNACLLLELDRSLSPTYWLNVNDPGFPFVGVIEHTNFDDPSAYQGRHIVYLSRYMATEDPVWDYDDQVYLDYAFSHLQRMFPQLERSWIQDFALWRAPYAQPIAERDYSHLIPDRQTPFANALIATMAQIYPEDRGTNYAIREGRAAARTLIEAPRW